jgi:hypothetical protein
MRPTNRCLYRRYRTGSETLFTSTTRDVSRVDTGGRDFEVFSFSPLTPPTTCISMGDSMGDIG